MKLGRKKLAIYGLILAGGLIGLLVDSLGRSDSAADPQPGAASLLVPAAPATTKVTVEGPPIAPIFERVSDHAAEKPLAPDSTPGRDAFAMSDDLRTLFAGKLPEVKIREQEKKENERERRLQEAVSFQSNHQLKGTTLREDGSWAIIDDRVVRVGEQIEGFSLRSIERYRARFTKDDLEVVLTLPVP